MKKQVIILGMLVAVMGINRVQAQINIGEKALGAVSKGITALTLTDADAAALSKPAVEKMDKENEVAADTDPYAIRLNRLFGKHKNESGLSLNYKVYKTKDVNAFATADGSVRVFSGLMEVMDDNQLLAVIGHEIGHVVNHDSRDAMREILKKDAVLEGAASQSKGVAKLTDNQLTKLGSAMLDAKYSRKQESEADAFSYQFMKRNGYNVNAVESSFLVLASLSQGGQANFLDAMMSSHPDSANRAAEAKKRAEKDGLYKPYVQQPIVNTPPPASKATTTAKKTTTTKKKTTAKKTATKKK